MSEPKPFVISKRAVYEAYLKVKANKGAAGVDEESIPDELKRAPFTIDYAEGLGFSRHRLRGPNWRRSTTAHTFWQGSKRISVVC